MADEQKPKDEVVAVLNRIQGLLVVIAVCLLAIAVRVVVNVPLWR